MIANLGTRAMLRHIPEFNKHRLLGRKVEDRRAWPHGSASDLFDCRHGMPVQETGQFWRVTPSLKKQDCCIRYESWKPPEERGIVNSSTVDLPNRPFKLNALHLLRGNGIQKPGYYSTDAPHGCVTRTRSSRLHNTADERRGQPEVAHRSRRSRCWSRQQPSCNEEGHDRSIRKFGRC